MELKEEEAHPDSGSTDTYLGPQAACMHRQYFQRLFHHVECINEICWIQEKKKSDFICSVLVV